MAQRSQYRRIASADDEGMGVVEEPEEEFDPEAEESPKTRNRLSFVAAGTKVQHCRQESHSLQRRASSASELGLARPVFSAADPTTQGVLSEGDGDEEEQPLLASDEPIVWHTHVEEPAAGESQSKAEHIRGEVFGGLGLCAILFAWVLFIGTAVVRLRSKDDRAPVGT